MLAQLQRKLAWQWWRSLVVALLLFFVVGRFDLSKILKQEPWGMVFFALSLLTLFVSRSSFHRFKHAVIELGQQAQRFEHVELWDGYMRVRGVALRWAMLPVICATLGVVLGLEPIAGFLLLLSSLLLFWLYRTPRQLWYRGGSD